MSKYPRIQPLFEKAFVGLYQQGKPSVKVDENDPTYISCLYRAPDGCKCAVGHMIDDDNYRDGMEDKNVRGLIGAYVALPLGFEPNGHEEEILAKIQRLMHDKLAIGLDVVGEAQLIIQTPAQFRWKLVNAAKDIAELFELDIPAIPTITAKNITANAAKHTTGKTITANAAKHTKDKRITGKSGTLVIDETASSFFDGTIV